MTLILVVDDELALADLLEDALLDEGFEVLKAGDGLRGLRIAEVHKPDVVVTDFMMPVKTGLELAEDLRSDPELRAIPVILMTGAQGGVAGKRTDLFRAVLNKPYKLEAMVDTIMHSCEQDPWR
ncbi:response regulator [Novosphingobium rosa]|uniref:response regulator n=1 Tax=Novosphingobium rosa TaxID=76978 RepID=UPI00082F4EFF|nr:response regulator [Novosphingobium rosa]